MSRWLHFVLQCRLVSVVTATTACLISCSVSSAQFGGGPAKAPFVTEQAGVRLLETNSASSGRRPHRDSAGQRSLAHMARSREAAAKIPRTTTTASGGIEGKEL